MALYYYKNNYGTNIIVELKYGQYQARVANTDQIIYRNPDGDRVITELSRQGYYKADEKTEEIIQPADINVISAIIAACKDAIMRKAK